MSLDLERILSQNTLADNQAKSDRNFTKIENEVNAQGEQIKNLDALVGLGGVAESGSNVNGSYVRFADGTQICTWETADMTSLTLADNGVISLAPISAALFINTPVVVFSCASMNLDGGNKLPVFSTVYSRSATSVIITMHNKSGTTITQIRGIKALFIGRWK